MTDIADRLFYVCGILSIQSIIMQLFNLHFCTMLQSKHIFLNSQIIDYEYDINDTINIDFYLTDLKVMNKCY